jgi:2,4-dienoyl-CoA reductase-like NADH-dependent reductase (Old Yellow Enzyme family)/thioredoxin reductase
MSGPTLQRLFEPIDLGPIQVRNRIMLTTHGGAIPSGRYVRYLETRAAGGVGLVAVSGAQAGVAHVSSVASRFMPSYAGDFDATAPNPATQAGIAYFDGIVTPMLRERAEAVHRHGASCVGQVFHLGSYRDFDNFRPPVAPSAVVDEEDHHLPHALDEGEIEELVVAFGHAVRRVRDAGLDGAEIHCAHGFLINEFLSPATNRRSDRYGGSFENRLRFLNEVLDAAGREAPAFPIGIRINGDELIEGGLDPAAVAAIVRAISRRIVYVNVSGGNASGLKDGVKLAYASPWLAPMGYNVAAAAQILNAEQAEKVLEEGAADMVGMVRALIADPDLPLKASAGQLDRVRPCIGQNECHAFHGTRGHMVCAVNAAAGREEELAEEPTAAGARVVVVGGGPGGLEAARAAAARGARVVLLERESELGGQLRWVKQLPGLSHLADYVDFQARELDRLGVEVRLSTQATVDALDELAPDVTMVATGSVPRIPEVPGIGLPHVLTAVDVLAGTPVPGSRVLVCGGQDDHLPPLLVADLLAERGCQVDLIVETVMAGQSVERRTLNLMLRRLAEREVRIRPLLELAAVTPTAAVLRNHFTKREERVEPIDCVVLACGGLPVDDLLQKLRASRRRAYGIGDCQSPRRIIHAVLDGARSASTLRQ